MESVKQAAHPGVPDSLLGGTNGKVMTQFTDFVVTLAVERLERLVSASRGRIGGLSPRDLVLQGFSDAVRVFVKNEPHKIAKIDLWRLRLIWSVSLVDQIVERVLFEPLCKENIDNWVELPAKPGMGSTDQDFEILWDQMTGLAVGGEVSGLEDTDINAWDLSVKWWMQVADSIGCLMNLGVSPESDYGRVILNRCEVAVKPVIALSDGRLYVCKRPGRQLSGKLRTSDGNSRMRVMLAEMRGVRCIAMGDDCVESRLRVPAGRFYESLGFTIEVNVTEQVKGTVFCSFRHKSRGAAEPVRWVRTLFRFISRTKRELADYAQLEEELRHVEEPLRGRILAECFAMVVAGAPVGQVGAHESA